MKARNMNINTYITPSKRTPTQKKFFKERKEVRHHDEEFEIHCNASNVIYLVMPHQPQRGIIPVVKTEENEAQFQVKKNRHNNAREFQVGTGDEDENELLWIIEISIMQDGLVKKWKDVENDILG